MVLPAPEPSRLALRNPLYHSTLRRMAILHHFPAKFRGAEREKCISGDSLPEGEGRGAGEANARLDQGFSQAPHLPKIMQRAGGSETMQDASIRLCSGSCGNSQSIGASWKTLLKWTSRRSEPGGLRQAAGQLAGGLPPSSQSMGGNEEPAASGAVTRRPRHWRHPNPPGPTDFSSAGYSAHPAADA